MNKNKILAILGVWIGLVVFISMSYKFFIVPKVRQDREQEEIQQKKAVIVNTSSPSRYKTHVKFGIDSFSGYSVLRSRQFVEYCNQSGVDIELVDDGADYNKRLSFLRSGEFQMAVFTLDALIASSAKINDIPATVISIIDESNGADGAVVSNKFSSLDSLNDPNTKFVLVPDSPSQTLVQVIRHYFKMDRLPSDPFIRVSSPNEVIDKYNSSNINDKLVFVTWQPEILKITSNKNYSVLIDSSKFKGYILDVIVVSRDFLLKNESVVRQIQESYFRANYDLSNKIDLVKIDGKLSDVDANNVAEGISWRNTQENYANFGITKQSGYSHIEDSIVKITRLLVQSGTINSDPTAGNPNVLYYDKILRSLYDSDFHPGSREESVKATQEFKTLTDKQWESLVPVGTMEIEPLVFARGTSKLIDASEQILIDLSEKFKTWDNYYLLVRGHTSGDNTPENLLLQKQRADEAVKKLKELGVPIQRVRAEASKSNGSTTVKFVLGQLPY